MTDKEKIDEILTRGVGEFIDPDGIFRKKLELKLAEKYDKEIIIKLGADPTRPDLHLGHAVVLRKLRKLQDLGCKIVFIVGDFTTLLGDPTGKSKVRPKVKIQDEINNTSSPVVSDQNPLKGVKENIENKPSYIPTSDEIAKNMSTYIDQIERSKILDLSPEKFSWIKNSDWFLSPTDIGYGADAQAIISLDIKTEQGDQKVAINIPPNSFLGKGILFENSRMQTSIKPGEINLVSLRGLLWTLQYITHSQLIDRDMFQQRIQKKEELYMHEMLYPVIQGIDSHQLSQIYGSCDLEVGGTDQTFNMLIGRNVMKANNKEPQSVLAFKLLEGLDGKEKMSKSLDNYIGITDEPNEMYGKVMSIPDSSIGNYFELCTFTPLEEVKEIREKVSGGSVNPKDLKMNLAKQIVAIYYGEEVAQKAEENFTNTFSKKEVPSEIEEIEANGKMLDVFVVNGITESTSAARRLFNAGAVTDMTEDRKLTLDDDLKSGHVYKIGKHRFIKIK